MTTTLRAPAKVNLTLEVLARRDDGYHTLRSLVLPIGLADELTIAPAATASFACAPGTLGGDDNLVARALRAAGVADRPFAVTLRKHVPVGAGLGGGSSDAATALLAAAGGAFGPVDARDWVACARALGSDVPLFLTGTGALIEGTGERVTAIGALPPWWVVLAVPDVHVATGPAYGALANERARRAPPTRPRSSSISLRALEAVQRADFDAAIACASNDFETVVAAAYPAVATTLAALRAAGAAHAILSGSGGACFALARDAAAARALADAVRLPAGAALHVVPLAASDAWRT